jgi:hypothetical protein
VITPELRGACDGLIESQKHVLIVESFSVVAEEQDHVRLALARVLKG